MEVEQYMDFLRNRAFRETLLCHRDRTPSYNLGPEAVAAFHVASPARPAETPPELAAQGAERFEGLKQVVVTCREPVMKSAMHYLHEIWPDAVPFEELCRVAHDRLPAREDDGPDTRAKERQFLANSLLQMYAGASINLVELSLRRPRLARAVSPRPVVSPLARLQAEAGNRATSLRHESVRLNERERLALRHLDGSRDRAALAELLGGADAADEELHKLARHGFLMA
jgi:methyltransferase-like protein